MKSKYTEKEKWVMHELRRIHTKWKPRKVCYVNARIARGKYKCVMCENIFGPREIDLDHIKPVICPANGFIDWNTYIDRLFVETAEYQVLCKGCHKAKTAMENIERV